MNKKSISIFMIFLFIYTMALIHILRPDLIYMTGYRQKSLLCVEEKAVDFMSDNLAKIVDRDVLLNRSLKYSIKECDQYIRRYAEEVYQNKYEHNSSPDSTVEDVQSDIVADLKIYFKDLFIATFEQADKAIEREK